MKKNFSQNLRHICAKSGSISHVCREIGINRHQFGRYLNGESLPAAHTLHRISSYLKVAESDLFEPNDQFIEKHKQHFKHIDGTPADILTTTFSDQSKRLRRYLGHYHVYLTTPTWDGQIMCILTHTYEQNGYVVARTLQRAKSKDGSMRQRARFDGLATFRGNRIYVIEREPDENGSIAETVLYPDHRQQVNYLRGVTLGVASRPGLAPFVSKTIWKRLSERMSVREAVQACGVYGFQDRRITPTVREFMQSPIDTLPQ
ncbi:XRE family transcriptional regulator [Sulfitobacter sp. SK012]|uniref:helix-turn-helix transcriptional regulator n=1 Tax=Sulfitobacter sp. SK012 TaxID=1389005 RepID=UPI000E0B9463|nr:helix-turn-helix transcriptional regulator [Sulfitobacter sp. SK012]AXI45815.1 XRE family transcriptional regulator [Sulfitobacter sp. SK012]